MFPIMAGNSASTGYNLTRSLRFRRSAGGYLSRTAGAGNQQIMTLSFWFKRGVLGVAQYIFGSYSSGSAFSNIYIESTDQIGFADAASATNLLSTQVFRDPSAWYHIVVAIDTTQATAANRVKFYVNNVQITAFAASTYPAQNTNLNLNNAVNHTLFNNAAPAATNYTDGYLAETNFINALQLTPSSFGSTNALTGVWQPARYTGSYGTNGFYLPFTDNSALTTSSNVGLGKDFSGNGNYYATNNISITAGVTYDSMTDVPTLTSASAANYGIVNPIGNGSGTISNGNLRAVTATTLPDVGNFAMQSGKWYWEVTLTTASNPRVGVYDAGSALPTAGGLGGTAFGWCIINGPSRIFNNNVATAYGSFNGSNGDVVMLAYDATDGKLWYGANGTWFASGDPATAANPSQTSVTGKAIVAATASGSGSNTFDYNFGQRPFAYTPPTGYVALNTYNLPTSTIVKGNTVMDATLYTGNGSTQTITNAAGFRPDLVWYKGRSTAYNNSLFDSVRGATKQLISNTTDAEATLSGVTAFNSNGFSLGSDANGNNNGTTYVGWQWQAGQGSSSSNTNGTITSTVSVNASAGFSVVTYTGNNINPSTVGHGLGVAPSWVIVKPINTAVYNWNTYHISLGNTQFIALNTDSAASSATSLWNNTSPTSTVFTINSVAVNTSATTYVAYCWTPIAGYSAFGSYTGNGSDNGPFVYTGFLPKWVLIKRTDSVDNWILHDTGRNTYNTMTSDLYPNLANAEDQSWYVDALANGFKIRSGGSTAMNTAGGTYIYAAFASNPFKNSLAF